MYVNDYFSKLGAAPSGERYRVPTPSRAVPPPTVTFVSPPAPVRSDTSLRVRTISRPGTIVPVVVDRMISKPAAPPAPVVVKREIITVKAAPMITPAKPTGYLVKAKMAPSSPVEDAPSKRMTLPAVIKSMTRPVVSDYYRKPVVQPAKTPSVATLTTTSAGKTAIEFTESKTAGSSIISQDKPLVQLVDKPAPIEAGAGPTTQDWVRYGMIAVGVFILTQIFASGKSPRLKRVH